jgi:hypothetical protein
MPKLRVHYDDDGQVVGVEHRPGEDYEEAGEPEGVSTLVVDSEDIPDAPPQALSVKRGKLKADPKAAADADDAGAQPERVKEILETDKSELSDEDWFKLFREYVTLTGAF